MGPKLLDIQSLISLQKIVKISDIDTTNAYIGFGYWQKGTRKKGDAGNSYPAFVMTIADLLSGGSGGVQSVTANNGLTISNIDPLNPNIQLGGTLLQNTTIANSGFNLLVTGTGKVGIGTTTPAYTLEVNGDINIEVETNVYRIRGLQVLRLTQALGAANIGIGEATILNDQGNGGAIAIGASSEATAEGISIGRGSKTDSTTFDSIAIGRDSFVDQSSIRGVAIGRSAKVRGGAQQAFAFGYHTLANQSNTFIIGYPDPAGPPGIVPLSVGIGTNAPTSKLHVVGIAEYVDNAAALAAGLTIGAFYRTGDLLKIVN